MANMSILAKLGLDATGLKAGLVKARRGVTNFAKSAGAKLLALAGVGGFGMVIRSAIAFGSTVSDLATRTGTTVEQFGALRDVSRDAGVEQSVLERGLRNVALRAQEAADGNKDYQEAIERLGLDMDNFLKMGTAEKFEAVSRAAGGAANQSEAFADVAKILGEKAGPQLVEVLRKVDKEGLGNLTNGLLATGAIMSNDTAQALDKLEDDLQRVKDQIIISAGAFLIDMLPSIKKTVTTITDFVKENKEIIKQLGKLVVVLASVKAGMVAGAIVTKALALANLPLAANTKKSATAMALLNKTMKANPIGVVIAAVTAATVAFALFNGKVNEIERQVDSFKKSASKLRSEIDELNATNKATADSTKMLKDRLEEMERATEEAALAEVDRLRSGSDRVANLEKEITAQQKILTISEKEVAQKQKAAAEAKEKALAAHREYNQLIKNSKITKLGIENEGKINALRDSAIKLRHQAGAAEKALAEAVGKRRKASEAIVIAETGIFTQTKKNKELNEKLTEDLAKSANNLDDVRRILGEVGDEFDMADNKARQLEAVTKRQNELLAKVAAGVGLSVEETEELRKNGKEILTLQKALGAEAKAHAETLKNKVNEARQDELNKMQALLGDLKTAADEEERRAKAAGDAAAAKEKEVANLRKDLVGAEDKLGGFKKFFKGPDKADRFGKVKKNTAEMWREWNKLQAAGGLPEGVKDFRGFQKHIQDQAAAAKQERDAIVAKGRAAKVEAAALRAKEKAHKKELADIDKKVADREKEILTLREKLQDKELKTLEQLADARNALEKLLNQAAKGIQVKLVDDEGAEVGNEGGGMGMPAMLGVGGAGGAAGGGMGMPAVSVGGGGAAGGSMGMPAVSVGGGGAAGGSMSMPVAMASVPASGSGGVIGMPAVSQAGGNDGATEITAKRIASAVEGKWVNV